MGFLSFSFGAKHSPDPWALFLRVSAISAEPAKSDPLKPHKGCLCCVSHAMGWAPGVLSSPLRAAPLLKAVDSMAMCAFLQEAVSETEVSMREVWGVLSGIIPAKEPGNQDGAAE